MVTSVNIVEAFSKWTHGRFVLLPWQYTGREPSLADINTVILERIYLGIKADVGPAQATNFAWFVAELQDMSASAFLQAFQRFWDSGCTQPMIPQEPRSGRRMTGRGSSAADEAFVLAASSLRPGMSDQEVIATSARLKWEFVALHSVEISKAR